MKLNGSAGLLQLTVWIDRFARFKPHRADQGSDEKLGNEMAMGGDVLARGPGGVLILATRNFSSFPSPHFSRRTVVRFGYRDWNDGSRCWDKFYKLHNNKFFKDRHYLEKDWGSYFEPENDDGSSSRKVMLEVGCGAGNTIFPLLAAFPSLFINACDFSSEAISLVKSHKDFTSERINAFVYDVTKDDLSEKIMPSSVDVLTLVFVLSAVSPEKMHLILKNVKNLLKPTGCVLLRDYAEGDFAQVKLQSKNQAIGKNFYVRGDGTLSYFFSQDTVLKLFKDSGYINLDMDVYCKKIENRSKSVTMERRWIRAIFRSIGTRQQVDGHHKLVQLTPLLQRSPINH